jgi:hypothetical protein
MGNQCCCCIAVRERVSKKKRRTTIAATPDNGATVPPGGVNLDLVAITPRIIAMGFPATGVEALYRNPCEDVVEYLSLNFGDGYRVYNLCSEPQHQYDASRFDGRVAVFPFPDHHPCPLAMIPAFVADATQHLDADERNAVCVHCKAGKGRTGLMITCLLIAAQAEADIDAASALEHYASQRSLVASGVTHRSQIRYAQYYAALRRSFGGVLPAAGGRAVVLTSITLVHLYDVLGNVAVVSVACGGVDHILRNGSGGCTFDRVDDHTMRINIAASTQPTSSPIGIAIKDDFRIELRKSSGAPVAAASIHTLFVEPEYGYLVMDKVYKHKTMPNDARMLLQYAAADGADAGVTQ